MKVKLFEVRDAATFLPVMAIKPITRDELERFLMARSGFGTTSEDHAEYVFLFRLQGGQVNYDIYEWGGSRTMAVAHKYIIENWEKLMSGDLICVEHILGERSEPKTSERISI